ncbi:MAG: DUF3127 domain-containing protein [Gammaproteobacteria bacterium]|jgi:single-stranded DNA-binding protein|nr:DUF3127 domain-containing protein [Gammaproteobacteria bacterium]MBT3868378.1 DUF3127 domain-containing protein [Gammaproteobacteria bacterium]MBT4377543.1 DUF3127 domain-containing protein [Gammaproteobacteria bacterium]MBT4615097.1 DUF3127 domain-containing protein [Gammaproteobacteria bacterium]MBT5200026.1 DUF3127 domain-containing protein [Gammaproteobacteria bacterium]
MSQSFEVQGMIHSIGDTTEYGNNGFTKREFVIKLTGENENPTYPNHIALELIKDKCAMMDDHNIGDEIQVQFNLSGRLWSGGGNPEKCFTSLQAWRVKPAPGQSHSSSSADQGASPPPFDDNEYDDIPF